MMQGDVDRHKAVSGFSNFGAELTTQFKLQAGIVTIGRPLSRQPPEPREKDTCPIPDRPV
jgi:hypothetical protein